MSANKFIREVGIIGLTQALTNLGTFLLLPIITKSLGTYEYGIWAQITTTISLLSPLALLGLSMAFVRFLAVEKDIKRIREDFYSIFIFVLFSGIIVSLMVFFLSDFLAKSVFNDEATAYYIKVASFLILFTTLEGIALFYFRVFRQIKIYALLTICETFGRLFFSYILLIAGFGVLGVIGATLAVQGFIVIISLLLIISQIGFVMPKFHRLSEFLRYGVPLTPNTLIYWITNSSDRYLIGIFLGLDAVGIYSAAYYIGSLLQLFVTPLQFILFPELSKLYDENKIETIKTILSHSTQYFLLVAIPAVVGLSVLSKPILEIFTTPEFASGSIVIPFIALSGLFGGIFQIIINITHLFKNTRINLLIHIMAAATNLALNVLLIPFIGILGAAIATLISYILMVIIGTSVSFKDLSFDLSFEPIIKSIIAAAIMAIAISFFLPQNILSLIIAICFGTSIYFLLMILMRAVGKREFELIIRLFRE